MVQDESSYEYIEVKKHELDGFIQKDRENDRCVMFVHGLTGQKSLTWQRLSARKGFIHLILEDPDLRSQTQRFVSRTL